MFWILILILSLTSAIYLYIAHLYKYWERKGAKQKSSFYEDNIRPMVKKYPLMKTITEFYNRIPDARCIGLYQFQLPILMLRDPDLIKQICVKDFEYFLDHRTFIPGSDPLWDKNLFALKGQKWRDMRATLSPSFTGSKMRQMYVLMQECAENFVKFLTQNEDEILEIELKDAFTRYTNDIIASTAFGIKCDSLKEKENEFYLRGKQATDFTGFWKNIKFLIALVIPWLAKLLGVGLFEKPVRAFFRQIIRETVEYREKNHVERPDMINLLMHARNEAQKSNELKEENNDTHQKRKMDLSIDDITAQALLFFFAGFETVSTVMCFVCYELAKNPDIQRKLVEELDEFRRTNEKVTYEGLAKLTYLDMVFCETMRRWPPTLVTDRQCTRPYVIQPEKPDEKPIHLACDDNLWLPIWPIHHDPKYWEDPDKFDPERFSPENKEKIVPYTYIPFGAGPRLCIASRFATIEVKAVICALLEIFEIVPTEKSCIPFVPNTKSFTLVSQNGFWFGLKRRKCEKSVIQ